MTQFSLMWDEFKTNVCEGLSSLQQNGEFVDMTLAADGHLVKVHQLVLALASPYIKELISSAQCPHPVIFLKRISYETLCSLLEYVYTGEVSVVEEKMDEFLEAGKELCIKGLDMKPPKKSARCENTWFPRLSECTSIETFDTEFIKSEPNEKTMEDTYISSDQEEEYLNENEFDENSSSAIEFNVDGGITKLNQACSEEPSNTSMMQFTVSNMGRLRMILNRYMYYLKYTGSKRPLKQWRCVEYLNRIKCPAVVITKKDKVIKRVAMHTHPFHDVKILKKVQQDAVFMTAQEAESFGNQ